MHYLHQLFFSKIETLLLKSGWTEENGNCVLLTERIHNLMGIPAMQVNYCNAMC